MIVHSGKSARQREVNESMRLGTIIMITLTLAALLLTGCGSTDDSQQRGYDPPARDYAGGCGVTKAPDTIQELPSTTLEVF